MKKRKINVFLPQLVIAYIRKFKLNLKFRGAVIDTAYCGTEKIGRGVVIQRDTMIANAVSIDDYTKIGAYNSISCGTIGKFCAIGSYNSIGGAEHPIGRKSISSFFYLKDLAFFAEIFDEYTNEIHIGNDVWIGDGCRILQGVNIGNGAVIGAGCVVTKDIPSYAVVVGVPSKIIKYRFSIKDINALENLQWWNMPYDWIYKNRALFALENVDVLIHSLEKYKNEYGKKLRVN